jgi:hypothetical protein
MVFDSSATKTSASHRLAATAVIAANKDQVARDAMWDSRQIKFGLLLVMSLPLILLRVWHLDAKSIWFDEAASWRTSSLPPHEMLRSLAGNVHVPVYYMVLKGWTWVWGDSPTALRSCSVASGLIAIAIAGALVAAGSASHRCLRAGAAMALYGVSPLAVRYSREAVMYTLATALVLGSAWLLLVARERRQTRHLWIASALLACGIYTHYYVLLHAFVHGVLVVWDGPRHGRLQYFLIAVIPFIAFVPWVPTFWHQLRLVHGAYWIAPLTWQRTGDLLWQLWAADDLDGSIWRGVMGCSLTVVTLFACWRWGGEVGRLVAVHFLVVVVSALAASVLWRSIVMPRYFVPAHALLLCGVAATLAAQQITGRLLCLLFFVILSTMVANLWLHLVPVSPSGLRAAVSWVHQNRSSNDVVLVGHSVLYLPWRYYDPVGQVYLTVDGTTRMRHYDGTPLFTPTERQPGENVARMAPVVWMVDGPASAATTDDMSEAKWRLVETRTFQEAFHWQSPISVKRYENTVKLPFER